MDGEKLINAIAKILNEKNIRCYDSAIISELSKLSKNEILKLIESK